MTSTTPSLLLGIPRELRNIIYSYLSKQVTLAETGEGVSVMLHSSPIPAVMLVCQAVRREYTEIAFESSVAIFTFGGLLSTSRLLLLLRPSVHTSLLRRVKRVMVQTGFRAMMVDMDKDKLIEHAQLLRRSKQDPTLLENAVWTPTKAHVAKLSELLLQIEHLVSPEAKVLLHIMCGPDEEYFSTCIQAFIFQPEVFYSMAKDVSVPFTKKGKLDPRVVLRTAVSQDKGGPYHRSLMEDGDDHQSLVMSDLDEYAIWYLRPMEGRKDDEASYFGLWPEFGGILAR